MNLQATFQKIYHKLPARFKDTSLYSFAKMPVSLGVAVGLFCAFIPLPFQMLIAASLATCLTANIPISVLGVWVTNPITIPPIFYFAYQVGEIFLTPELSSKSFSFSLDWIMHHFTQLGPTFLLGCFVCGVSAAILGFCFVQLTWQLPFWNALKKQ